MTEELKSNQLKDKIEQIIKEKGLNPSKFADEIGVQRASISHILVGRNKASLDIVTKILKRFPDIKTDWLLGVDNPLENSMSYTPDSKKNEQLVSAYLQNTSKEIERFIVFYTDKTFDVYNIK